MIGPIVIQGAEPSNNVVDLKEFSTGALLIMRRPPVVRSRETNVRWYVWCQALLLLPPGSTFVSVPAYPARRDHSSFVADELSLGPLPALPKVMAVAYFPTEVLSWRFEFYAEDPEHPDAKAEVWVGPIVRAPGGCGFFRTPCRGALP